MNRSRRLIHALCLSSVLMTCFLQTGCYYLRVCRDKTICVLRRSPVSIRKKYTACNFFAPYQEPAGFSQTYKDHLYLNDPYVQPWEVTQVGFEQPIVVPETTQPTPVLPDAPMPPATDYPGELQAPVPLPQQIGPQEVVPVVPELPTPAIKSTPAQPLPDGGEAVPPPIPDQTKKNGKPQTAQPLQLITPRG